MKKPIQILLLLIFPVLVYSQTNNRNNGRSNKDRCCRDGILITDSNNNTGVLDQKTTWYKLEKTTQVKQVKISNPINQFKKANSFSEAKLFTSEGKYVETIKIEVREGEIILPKMKLEIGSYYIELMHQKELYRTGISIGEKKKLKTAKYQAKG